MNREELLKIAKPILFNTEMVQAILEGRKTVTRRVIKPKSKKACGISINTRRTDGVVVGVYECDEGGRDFDNALKPPFQAGDYLYVRESVFQGVAHSLDMSGEAVGFLTDDFEYFADGIHQKDHWKDKHQNVFMRRRPSIHMPKEAARIFLKVTDVRVERLQDMEEEDAINEGIHPKACPNCSGIDCDLCSESEYTVMDEFMHLWNSTIKKADLDKYGWEANPWVWVIEFERVEV